jgi:hypothetical protein
MSGRFLRNWKACPEGVYRCDADGAPVFEAGAPTDCELHALLQTVITQLLKGVTRQGSKRSASRIATMCMAIMGPPKPASRSTGFSAETSTAMQTLENGGLKWR